MGVIDAGAYRDQAIALLPPGRAWATDPDTTLGRLLLALADEHARVDMRVDRLLDEADPRKTQELLVDWERVAGLPDGCTLQSDVVADRQRAVVGKIADRGGQSIAYFTEFAARYGYAIAIEELTSGDCGMGCGEAIGGDDWRHVWVVQVQLVDGDAFDLECLFARARPAHTIVHFSYSGV